MKEQEALDKLKEACTLLFAVEQAFRHESVRVDSDVPAGGHCKFSRERACQLIKDRCFNARTTIGWAEDILLRIIGVRSS